MADNINERLAREYTAGQIDTERAPEAPTLFTPTEDVSSIVRSIKALTSTVNQLMGRSGTAFDKAVSMRDLVASGVLALKIGGTVVASSPTPSTGGGSVVIPAEPDGPGYRDPRPVLLTPPVLTEVQAHGAFRNVIIIWKRVAYRNHAYVEVWRSLTNNLSTAARLGTTTADVYADATGAPNTTYYYWVRAVNIEGNIGPFHAVLGAAGTLAPLVDDEVPPQFIKRAMIALAAIDDALIANLSAAKVTFGEMHGDRIAVNSLNGDRVTANTFHGDKIIGNTVTAAKINGYNLVVYSGTYTGYAWPATGNGFYLGPQGLLLGNANTGKYFQVEADGNVYAPGFSIVNGTATFSGALSAATGSFAGSLSAATGTFAGSLSAATGTFSGSLSAATGTFSGTLTASAVNAVNSINLGPNAVGVANQASGAGVSDGTHANISTSVTVPAGKTWKICCIGIVSGADASGPSATAEIVLNGTITKSVYATAGGNVFGSSYRLEGTSISEMVTVTGPATFTSTLGNSISSMGHLDKVLLVFGTPQ